MKYLDKDGLIYLKSKIATLLGTKVDKAFKTGSNSEYKVLSDNNLTDELVTKINNAGDSSFSGDYNDLINKPTIPTNNNQLTNGAGYQTASDVQTAITNKIGSVYKAKGSVAFASLPALNSANEGNVYNVTDNFTTTADFIEGAGKTYPAGTNVVIVNTSGSTYKYDVLSGTVDLSDYVKNSDLVAITNAEIDTIFNS